MGLILAFLFGPMSISGRNILVHVGYARSSLSLSLWTFGAHTFPLRGGVLCMIMARKRRGMSPAVGRRVSADLWASLLSTCVTSILLMDAPSNLCSSASPAPLFTLCHFHAAVSCLLRVTSPAGLVSGRLSFPPAAPLMPRVRAPLRD